MTIVVFQTPELEYAYFCEQQSNGAAAVKAGNHKPTNAKKAKEFVKQSQFTGKNTSKSKRKIRTVNILMAKRGTPSSFKETMAKAEAGVKRSQSAQKAAATRAAKRATKSRSASPNAFTGRLNPL